MNPNEAQTVILAAVDLAEDSPGVLSRALELASTHRDSALHVLSVMQPTEASVLAAANGMGQDPMTEAVGRLRSFVRSQVDDHAIRHPDVDMRPSKIQIHCALGSPASEIVWLAAHLDADVIVVATHARKGLRRLLLGSVAEKVSRLAGCPVMVVRDKHHAAPWKVPEMEPLCGDCAEKRRVTSGAELWCARHSVNHVRAHVVCRGDHAAGPSPVEAVTGI